VDAAEWGTYRPRWRTALYLGALRNRIAHGRLKKHMRRTIPRISPRCDVEIAGLKIRCHMNDNYTERAIAESGARDDLAAIAMTTDGLRPGDVFVDVGANCGLFTLFAARQVGSSGRVIAIEPIPEMLGRLRFNIRANGFDNVDIFETAVGPDTGTTTLHVHTGQFGQSSIHRADGLVPTAVPVTTLLNVIEASGIARIDAMKIDIEGYEDRALIPFLETAPSSLWPGKIFMETRHKEGWQSDLLSALVAAGYRKEWNSVHDALFVRT
jgi:FkbM family methyltransferase